MPANSLPSAEGWFWESGRPAHGAPSSWRGCVSAAIHAEELGSRKCARSPTTASPSSSQSSRALAYIGPNLCREKTPSDTTSQPGHEACWRGLGVPHPPPRLCWGRVGGATSVWGQKGVMQTCLQYHPREGTLPQGTHPAPSLPGLVWGDHSPGQVLTVPAQPRRIPGNT